MEGSSSKDKRKDQESSQDHVVRASKKMWLYRENETLCDVILIAGEDKQRISAHRVVLSAASDYFEEKFTGDFRKSREEEVILDEIPGDDLRRLVKFCYTGEIELSEESSVESVKTLMSSANLLQLKSVVKDCGAFLERHLSPSNCLGFAESADLVTKADKCRDLMPNQKSRRSGKGKLLTVTMDKPRKYFELRSYCPETKEWTLEKKFEFHRDDCNTVLANNNIIFFGASKGVSKKVDSFDIKTKTVKSLLPMKYYRRYSCAAVLDGFLYVFDGVDSKNSFLNTVQRLDLSNRIWNIETLMQTKRSRAGAAAFKGRLFVIGGINEKNQCLNSVERYDPQTKEWSLMASMKKRRYHPVVTATRDYIYAFGGKDHEGKALSCVEKYDPKENSWTIVATLKISGRIKSVLVGEKILYASKLSRKVVQFDPENNTLTEFAQLDIPSFHSFNNLFYNTDN